MDASCPLHTGVCDVQVRTGIERLSKVWWRLLPLPLPLPLPLQPGVWTGCILCSIPYAHELLHVMPSNPSRW